MVLGLPARPTPSLSPVRQSRVQVIDALNQCHQENPIAKFWGVCTEKKIALDRCFRQEKKDNRCVERWQRRTSSFMARSDGAAAAFPSHGHAQWRACAAVLLRHGSCPCRISKRGRPGNPQPPPVHGPPIARRTRRARNFERARAERERLESKLGTRACTPGYGVRVRAGSGSEQEQQQQQPVPAS